jgi:hypothetical protein
LKNKGIDTKQKIVDASGARPILRNTLPQEIAQLISLPNTFLSIGETSG